ncbi:MAG: hypothetical protein SOT81_09505 [Treponema sp.]|nr:hypothetical protein [Treponema sp.]
MAGSNPVSLSILLRGFEVELTPTIRRKRRQEAAGSEWSRAGTSKQDVCDWKPNPVSLKNLLHGFEAKLTPASVVAVLVVA